MQFPSRYKVKRALLELASEQAAAIRERVAGLVAPRGSFPGQFAITMDAWTSRGVHGYLGVTMAYIDDKWELQSPILACAPLPPPHTGGHVAGALRGHLPAPAELQHVLAVVTDNGANFRNAARELVSDRALPCAVHCIQLALRSVAKEEPLRGILQSIIQLLGRFANSQPRREALVNAARLARIEPLMPVVPAPTRWDSHYYVLDRFLRIQKALEVMTYGALGYESRTDYDEVWMNLRLHSSLLKPLCELLGVFARCTKEMQAAKRVTLSRVPRMVDRLLAATSDEACNVASTSMRPIMARLHSEVTRRLGPLVRDPLVRAARFFDPVEFRDTFTRDDAGMFSAEEKLADDINSIFRLVASVFSRRRSVATNGQRDGVRSLGEATLALVSSESGWPADAMLNAIVQYRDMDKSDAEDPLDWWRMHGEQLQPLDTVARWFLCIPATSAESERTFSLAGRVVSPLRTRLAGERVHDLTILASELRRDAARTDAARLPARSSSASMPVEPRMEEDDDDDGTNRDDDIDSTDEEQHLLDEEQAMMEALEAATDALQRSEEVNLAAQSDL
jgi:hypothetical protein